MNHQTETIEIVAASAPVSQMAPIRTQAVLSREERRAWRRRRKARAIRFALQQGA
ncbi:MAG: hypothetical protein ACK46Q_09310 [Hyphomonas sp.]